MELYYSNLKFEWDGGNRSKNWDKHGIGTSQIEEVFFNYPLIVLQDSHHSHNESRWHALGHDNEYNLLKISFTIRGEKLSVISARLMNKKEKERYEKIT